MDEAKCKVGDRVWLNANERGTIVRFCTNEETCIVNSDNEGEVEMHLRRSKILLLTQLIIR